LTWRNKTLQVKNEKVKSFLANVQEFEKQIQVIFHVKIKIYLIDFHLFYKKASTSFDFKISTYENILKESIDAIQILRDELKLDPVLKSNLSIYLKLFYDCWI
jgi:hypothetical protein